MKTRVLAEIAIMSVIVFFLDAISHFLPIPGTNEGISLYLLPIFLISFRHGIKEGIFTALSASVLFLSFGHFHSFTWQQYFLDYPLALSVVALSGYYTSKLKQCDCNCESRNSYIIKGLVVGTLLKYFVNVISTYIFIEHYFEELVEHDITIFDSIVANSGVIFSLLYNVMHILPAALITGFLLIRIFKTYGNRILEKVN